MRHRQAGRHLGRPTDHRLSLYRNLVTDLLRYERITTTEAKAKEIRPLAEKMITLGKRGDLHAFRQALAFLYDGKVVKRVFDDIAPRFRDRPGGYTRITGLELRKGDGAKIVAIELVDYVDAAPTPRPERITSAPAATPARTRAAAVSSAPVAAAPAAVAVEDDEEAADAEDDAEMTDELGMEASEAPDAVEEDASEEASSAEAEPEGEEKA
jgi:large subunit ribosomal protein L17